MDGAAMNLTTSQNLDDEIGILRSEIEHTTEGKD